MTTPESRDRVAPYEPPAEENESVETDWRDWITPKHFAMAAYGCVLLIIAGPFVLVFAVLILSRLLGFVSD
ncbi:MAG: hypothetical protein ACR2NZ_17115 [Rubripirellula sp.]